MSNPAVFPASYVRLQTMADGTLRLTLDVEPMHSQKAFSLCEKPGVTFALARLTDDAAKQQMQDDFAEQSSDNSGQLPKEKKVLPTANDVLGILKDDWKPREVKKNLLSVECAYWCKTPKFWEFVNEHFTTGIDGEDMAAGFVRGYLHIKSRAELDSTCEARDVYIRDIQTPYRSFINRD